MNCRDLDSVLSPYLDGELVAAERVVVEEHLATCATCGKHVDVERHNLSLIRAAVKEASPAMPAGVRARVLGGLHLEQRRLFNRKVLQVSALAASVSCVAVLAHHEWKVFELHRYAKEVAGIHVRRYPVEIKQASPEQIQAWSQQMLRHAVTVPRIPNAVASGARLMPVRGKSAVQVQYEATQAAADGKAAMLSVFVMPDEDGDLDVGSAAQPDVDSSEGVNVVTWRNGDVKYLTASDLTESDIRNLMAPAAAPPHPAIHPPLDVRPASFQQ